MWRRIAPHARYFVLAGILLVASALGGWLVTGLLKPWIEIVGAVGLVLLALAAAMQPQAVKAAVLGRRTRYGSNAVVISLALLLIVALLSYLGTRYHARWDVTEEKQFSLSQQTKQILKGLDEPVEAVLFFTPTHYNRLAAEDLMKEYALQSPNFAYRIVDPETDRVTALNYQVSRDSTIIFQRGDRHEVTFGVDESDFTGTLLKLLSDETRAVYFVTGHGELNPNVVDGSGCSTIRQVLESENYAVDTLSLAVTDIVPEDAVALIVAGPTEPFGQAEVDRLAAYVDAGGRLMVLYEPGMIDPLLGLLQRYGLDISDNIVIEPTSNLMGDIASPVVMNYVYHQITKDLTGMPSWFPTARALQIMEPQPGTWTIDRLANTSSDAWAETDYQSPDVAPDSHEAKGPLSLAVAIEPGLADSGLGRLVVVGDADFMSDLALGTISGGLGNVDLFMNSIGWLAEEESLISIRPQEPQDRSVILTGPQANAIIYSGLLFAPLVLLAIGAYVWWTQR